MTEVRMAEVPAESPRRTLRRGFKFDMFAPGVDAFEEGKPMWQLLLVFLAPLLLSNVLQSVSQTMSSIWIGRLISTQALGAISAAFPIVILLVSAIMGAASGGTVLIGQAFGAGDRPTMKRVAGTVLGATLYLSIIVAVVGTLESSWLLSLLGTPRDIIGMADAYVKVVFWTMPVLALYAVYTTLIAGTGDSKTPFYALLVASALTIVVTPVFILGWFGLPRLGIVSVAVAGLIGNGCALGWLLVVLNRRNHPLRFDRDMAAGMRIDWKVLWTVVRIGVPATVQSTMFSLAEIVVLSFINHFGSTATAAYGAVVQVASYAQFPEIAVGIAASVFCAQYIGARREDKVGALTRAAVALNYAIGVPLVLICYTFAWSILGVFITDAHTLRVAHESLMIILWSIVVFGNTAVLTGIMRGSGTVLWPSILSVVAVWGVEVPGAYWLMRWIGLDGVWAAGPLGLCVALALQYGYYALVWKRKTHARLV